MRKLVYIHVGKTAGTSLRLTLVEAFGPETCSDPFVQTYMSEEEARRHRAFPVICGHISRADQLKWFPDREVITVLRHPIDRCLSFIHYVRNLPPESAVIAADARRLSILDLIETDDAQRNLNNTMVRQLGGHMLDAPDDLPELLERAKQTLQAAMWVGRQSTIDADLIRLGHMLDQDLRSVRVNVTRNRPRYETESSEVVNRLYSLNGYDLQLWQWAERELF